MVGPLLNRRAALVRMGAVTHRVAEAPERIDPCGVDLLEHCLECVGVSVDVGDDCDAHGATRDLSRRCAGGLGCGRVAGLEDEHAGGAPSPPASGQGTESGPWPT